MTQTELFNHPPSRKRAEVLSLAEPACPVEPGHAKGSETSREAALRITPRAGSLRHLVLGFIWSRGERGATDAEVEEALGLRHQTASARRRELVIGGFVRNSGEKRKTPSGCRASVWVLAKEEKGNQ